MHVLGNVCSDFLERHPASSLRPAPLSFSCGIFRPLEGSVQLVGLERAQDNRVLSLEQQAVASVASKMRRQQGKDVQTFHRLKLQLPARPPEVDGCVPAGGASTPPQQGEQTVPVPTARRRAQRLGDECAEAAPVLRPATRIEAVTTESSKTPAYAAGKRTWAAELDGLVVAADHAVVIETKSTLRAGDVSKFACTVAQLRCAPTAYELKSCFKSVPSVVRQLGKHSLTATVHTCTFCSGTDMWRHVHAICRCCPKARKAAGLGRPLGARRPRPGALA